MPLLRRHSDGRVCESCSCLGPEARAAAVDPAGNIPVAAVAVLDGLEQAVELVGVVGALHFEAVTGLVVVDQAAQLAGESGGEPGGLVAGDVFVACRVQVLAAEVGDVAGAGFLGVVPDGQECRAGGVGAFEPGEQAGDDRGPEGMIGDALGVLDAAQPPAGPRS